MQNSKSPAGAADDKSTNVEASLGQAQLEQNPMLGVVLTYGIFFFKERLEWVTIEATKFDENNNPNSWAIRRGNNCMSKVNGLFNYEVSPSYRDEHFYKEYRFSTAQEAKECWQKHYA